MTTLLRAVKAAQNIAASAALLLASASFAAALTETSETITKIARPAGIVISFDWRAGKSGTRNPRVVPASATVRSGLSLGGGSFVCSPAGFGRQSYCFSR